MWAMFGSYEGVHGVGNGVGNEGVHGVGNVYCRNPCYHWCLIYLTSIQTNSESNILFRNVISTDEAGKIIFHHYVNQTRIRIRHVLKADSGENKGYFIWNAEGGIWTKGCRPNIFLFFPRPTTAHFKLLPPMCFIFGWPPSLFQWRIHIQLNISPSCIIVFLLNTPAIFLFLVTVLPPPGSQMEWK